MGYHEDHINAVADRWARQYRESGMTADKFIRHMKKILLSYGWTEAEANKIVARATEKGRA